MLTMQIQNSNVLLLHFFWIVQANTILFKGTKWNLFPILTFAHLCYNKRKLLNILRDTFTLIEDSQP